MANIKHRKNYQIIWGSSKSDFQVEKTISVQRFTKIVGNDFD